MEEPWNKPTAAAAKSLPLCPTLCNPIDGSTPSFPVPGILQATPGVGCHFLLQCMKVKSAREAAQSCPTLSDPMDYSLLGFSVHGIFQARVLEWGAIAFSGNKPRDSKGGETQLTVLQSLCVSLGSHVVEMETEGSRVMWSPADEEGRFA